MRALACILLFSCAPALTPIPSSLPFVHIDPTLTGHVMSRDAAVVIAAKRIDDKAKADAKLAESDARAAATTRALGSETARADRNQRAATMAIVWTVIVSVVTFGAGFGLGYGISRAP